MLHAVAPRRYGVNEIDFWSLDVEGGELDVLQSIDFTKLSVGVLMVETDGARVQAGCGWAGGLAGCSCVGVLGLQLASRLGGWVRSQAGLHGALCLPGPLAARSWLLTCGERHTCADLAGAGHNRTKDDAVHSLLHGAGFDAVPKVGAGLRSAGAHPVLVPGACRRTELAPHLPLPPCLPWQGPIFNDMQKMNTWVPGPGACGCSIQRAKQRCGPQAGGCRCRPSLPTPTPSEPLQLPPLPPAAACSSTGGTGTG